MEKLNKALEELIAVLKNSVEYQNCIKIREQMNQSSDIKNKIQKIKDCQKKYIRSQYDESVYEELCFLEKELNEIPIYHVYLENLEKVNEKIDYIRDSFNQYFYDLLNKKY